MLKPSWRANPEAYKKWREEIKKNSTIQNNTIQNNAIQNTIDSLYTGSTNNKKPSWRSEPAAYEKWRLANKTN